MAVFGGGLVGSGGREAVSSLFTGDPGGIPSDLLVVNLVGSLFLGWYLSRRERAVGPRWSTPFWAIGMLGSFTTFSAFSLEALHLLRISRPGLAAAYVLASIVGGLLCAQIGQRLGAMRRWPPF